ncbi:carbon-nitrogen hydrolase family protein [Leucothrix arctica]|uniref:Carbon-nitrogen hydrolase family protein n=1 Tax=Leucothrix arctica TaxID=1481894 RepID=A0A317C2Y1_9GAMM|nr:carbon-nitrogen hydrolase family protein [Leucothrix arctica]PWQ92995.1 carbon-nitrogen hydrolase family protein [Leucothrix arctica]
MMTTKPQLKSFVIQFPITPDVLENEHRMLLLLNDIPKFSLVVFPEGALSGYLEEVSFVDDIDKEILVSALGRLKEFAMQAKIHLTFGSCIYEQGHWYNAAFYYAPNGEQFSYRKANLAISERGKFSAGNELSCFEIQHHGQAIKVAFQLCREIRFPEQWSALARQGAQIFIYATNAVGDAAQADVWRSHLISRAAENQRFVLCANVAGDDQKCPSMIIDPQGYTLWETLSADTKIGTCDLDLSATSSWYLDQSRQDIV